MSIGKAKWMSISIVDKDNFVIGKEYLEEFAETMVKSKRLAYDKFKAYECQESSISIAIAKDTGRKIV